MEEIVLCSLLGPGVPELLATGGSKTEQDIPGRSIWASVLVTAQSAAVQGWDLGKDHKASCASPSCLPVEGK